MLNLLIIILNKISVSVGVLIQVLVLNNKSQLQKMTGKYEIFYNFFICMKLPFLLLAALDKV
jgi:hypothetical protein